MGPTTSGAASGSDRANGVKDAKDKDAKDLKDKVKAKIDGAPAGLPPKAAGQAHSPLAVQPVASPGEATQAWTAPSTANHAVDTRADTLAGEPTTDQIVAGGGTNPLAAIPPGSALATSGPLAFALRVKNGGGASAVGQGNANRANAGSLNAKGIVSQSGGNVRSALTISISGKEGDPSNGGANGGGAGASSGQSTSAFAAQLKTLTGGLSGASPMNPGAAPAPAADNSAGLANAGMLAGPQTQPVAVAAGVPQPATSRAALAGAAENDVPLNTEPVRSVRVQIAGDDSQVELRLVEHAGALSVSVRSADGTLRTSLQDSLPELNSRLAAEHYETDTWTPGSSAPGHSDGQPGSDSGSGGNKQGGSSPEDHSGSKGGQPQSGQQNGRQDRAPAWVQQLAAFDGSPV